MFIGLIPLAISLFFIKSGLSFIVTFKAFFAKNKLQFSVSISTLKLSLTSSFSSLCFKSISFTGLSYIAPNSYAIHKMLNKSPLFAVSSKSATSSSNPMNLIGSSPTGASAGSSCIPVLSASLKNFDSIPSSNNEHIIPFDSCPLIFPFLIVISPGSSAPTCATITFNPFLTFGAPHTISKTSFPISTLHTCK